MNETGCQIQLTDKIQIVYISAPASLILFCESALALLTIWRTPALHTNAFLYIASLTGTDILIGFICLLEGCINSSTLRKYLPDVNMADSFVLGTCHCTLLLTMAHMSIISTDRYILIAHPFYYIANMTKRRTFKIILTTWTLCLLYGCIPMLFYRDDRYHKRCILLQTPLSFYLTTTILHTICLIIVCINYLRIACLAFRRKQTTSARKVSHTKEDLPTSTNNRLAAMKSVKFFVFMFGAVFLCTFPPQLGHVFLYFLDVPVFIYPLLASLYLVNSVFNFIIAFLMNTTFNQAVKKSLRDFLNWCLCKRRAEV